MKLTYIGPKKRHTFSFPIPYISKGELEGEVIFEREKPIEVKDAWANRLLEFCPQFFEPIQKTHMINLSEMPPQTHALSKPQAQKG